MFMLAAHAGADHALDLMLVATAVSEPLPRQQGHHVDVTRSTSMFRLASHAGADHALELALASVVSVPLPRQQGHHADVHAQVGSPCWC